MRVLFLYTSTNMCRDGDLWYYDEAAATVAACLRRAGHSVRFRTVNHDHALEEISAWIADNAREKTLLVFMTSLMFSAFGHDLPDTFHNVAPLRRQFRFPAAFVGVHAMLNAEETIAQEGIDFVGRGEMEMALPELCDALDRGRPVRDIANFWVKENGTVHRNPIRSLAPDLDALPHPARDLLPPAAMANERDGILTVVASRGCPMKCNFCSNQVLRTFHPDDPNYYRCKSVDRFLAEIHDALEADPSMRAIFIQDDVFCVDTAWGQEFLERYPREIGLPWGCNLLLRQARPRLVEGLRRAGCRQVHVGIESGSPHLRNKVLNKNLDDAQVMRGLGLIRESGIRASIYIMIGLPEETGRRFAESVRRVASYRADMVQVQIWQALKGSSLLEHGPGHDFRAAADNGASLDRKSWRLKFLFRYLHRLVAIHEELDARREKHRFLAGVLSTLTSLAIRFRWTPDLLLARDWDGRRRFPALWMESPRLRRWATKWCGGFWRDVIARETRLASLYIWPRDLGNAPTGRGWIGRSRVDLRETKSAARAKVGSA